jgi:hypothetical protein
MRLVSFVSLLFGFTVVVGGCGAPDSGTAPASQPPDSVRRNVEQSIRALNQMRESLAATIDTPSVDKNTFRRVCAPVGKRARALGQANGWVVQQLAKKYRNPAHRLDAEARRLHRQFADSSALTDRWIRTTRNGTPGWRYARRITVRSSCLACHGPKERRPAFVETGYPEDRAYGFEAGDLRGLYSVFVPDSTVPLD